MTDVGRIEIGPGIDSWAGDQTEPQDNVWYVGEKTEANRVNIYDLFGAKSL